MSAPEEVVPPPQHQSHQYHWLYSERVTEPCMSEWINGKWYSAGEENPIYPHQMYLRGWRYLEPAILRTVWSRDSKQVSDAGIERAHADVMADYACKHYRRVAGSPGESLLIRGLYEVDTKGFSTGYHVSPDDECWVAFDITKQIGRAEDHPAALVVFKEYPGAEIWVHFGYCLPEYRGKGAYKLCIQALRNVAHERGYSKVHTGVHPKNLPAQRSIIVRGGMLQAQIYTFPVEGVKQSNAD